MGPRRARCVVWHAPRVIVPEALLSALDRRGIGIVARSNAFGACAEVLALARESAGGERVVLLMVEPAGLTRIREVTDTVAEYAPGVALWSFESQANPQLSAYVVEDGEEVTDATVGSNGHHTPEARAPATFEMGTAPTLGGEKPKVHVIPGLRERLEHPKGHNGVPSEATGDEVTRQSGTRSLLSQEELSMLLSDEPREDAR